MSGALVEYISRMGASADLFARMSEAGSDDIVTLSASELKSLRIVTGSVTTEDWNLKSVSGQIYLVGRLVNERGTSKLIFTCFRKKRSMVSMVYIPAGSHEQAADVARGTVDAGYFVGDRIEGLLSRNRSVTIAPSNNDVMAIWSVTQADIEKITAAKRSTGFALVPNNKALFAGFKINFGDQGRSSIKNYAADCCAS